MTIIKWPWQNVGKTYLQLYEEKKKGKSLCFSS